MLRVNCPMHPIIDTKYSIQAGHAFFDIKSVIRIVVMDNQLVLHPVVSGRKPLDSDVAVCLGKLDVIKYPHLICEVTITDREIRQCLVVICYIDTSIKHNCI